ncbi:N-acetylmuramoyl-L-alanine amidase [Metabacillus arenae]|uniref:N-acetylmuramoyl-L-alanine amidase n=1 Tax=Metabacillus arenae TaxID=2771434 RepID=A0A926RYD4_9BACI|nr:N-acetylmuramoyl-L-alanine amidase [Metabacillus arenae]MBD1381077.1 N-acetylmuramoyl-L-alanine amidase [Metabacillus arenae]
MRFALDAGHAGFGVTPGKRVPDGSMYEWDFNSAVIEKLSVKLLTCKGVSILRIDDPKGRIDVPLLERTDKANDWKADVYYSQHANAFGSGGFNEARGIETFVYTSRSPKAVSLAEAIQRNIIEATGLSNRGVKTANFAVLRHSRMTAILQEGGFMTNREEAKLLKVNSYRETIAQAVFNAFVSHFKLESTAEIPIIADKPKEETGSIIIEDFIQFGDKGNEVKAIQNQLLKSGFGLPKFGADGKFGSETLSAVKAFQKTFRLTVDGIVGPETKVKLNEASKKDQSKAIVPYPGQLIRLGFRGKNVERIQRAVGVTPDGIFGPKTEAAIKDYQKRQGLEVDGIVGPITWNRMF